MNSNKRSNQQNVDNLDVLTEKATTFTPGYDPSEERLSIANHKLLKISGDQVLLNVVTTERACDNAISARKAVFDSFDSLVTRAINALRISEVPDQTISQGESIVRDLRNKRASEIDTPAKSEEGTENEESPKTNKIRGGSFNTKIENFRKFIVLLSTIPAYKPKEADLTVDSLYEKLESLKQANAVFVTADAVAEAARRQRDIVLYAGKTGLVDIAMDSKLYVKSAYGARSSQFKSVSGIKFTRKK